MMRFFWSSLLVLLLSASALQANEWLVFLEGNWKREQQLWVNGNMTASQATLTCKSAVGGKAIVSTVKTMNGKETTVLLITARQLHGVNSEGGTWSVSFDKNTADKIEGALSGKDPNGKEVSGKLTMTRTGADSYTMNAEVQIGADKLKLKVSNTRIKKKSEADQK